MGGGLNTYGYVEGNPINGFDLLGLKRVVRQITLIRRNVFTVSGTGGVTATSRRLQKDTFYAEVPDCFVSQGTRKLEYTTDPVSKINKDILTGLPASTSAIVDIVNIVFFDYGIPMDGDGCECTGAITPDGRDVELGSGGPLDVMLDLIEGLNSTVREQIDAGGTGTIPDSILNRRKRR